MIAFSCTCGRQFSVKPEFAGRSTRCPNCKQVLLVPSGSEAATVGLEAVPPTADFGHPKNGVTTDALGGSKATVESVHTTSPAMKRQERYVMGSEIARGGMGAVLHATDREIRREVAVKYLLDQSNEEKKLRFIEEAQITGQLEHPNIVPIHELGIDASQHLFFSMKMVKGRSLSQVLASIRKEPTKPHKEHSLSRLLNYFVSICNALAYSHSRGVVHRDLKPANVMIGDFGEVYVMDWGLAKVLQHQDSGIRRGPSDLPAPSFAAPDPVASPTVTLGSPGTAAFDTQVFGLGTDATGLAPGSDKVKTSRDRATDLTQEGSVMGTPVYMPPEQATGQIHAIDERSDIYALGAILYEILTLRPPINRDGNYIQVLQRVIRGDIEPPAKACPERARAGFIPPELAAISMKALALSPENRYQSVEFLRRDIELYLDGRSVSAKEDTQTELLIKFVKRNQGFVAVTTAALAVILVIGGWSLVVNLQARRDAETAYTAFAAEQKEKEARTRLAVPALVKAAQLEADLQGIDGALKQINLALEYDPESPEGRLLRGRLLIAKQNFKAAQADLQSYLTRRPKDVSIRELARVCEQIRPEDEDKGPIVLVAQTLAAQNYPRLAEELLRQHGASGDDVRQELLRLYLARLEPVWPRKVYDLTLDALGFHMQVKGDEVRDLTPLKGMILQSLELECGKLQSLDGLTGVPLQSFISKKTNFPTLAPLAGMPLTTLRVEECYGLSDLSPLQGMQLTDLTLLRCNGVRDLDILKGMPLKSARFEGCPVKDLSPLKGAPLTTLVVSYAAGLSDLSPLAGMPLKVLDLSWSYVGQDLAPLDRMPLSELDLSGAKGLRNVATLGGLPLKKLSLRQCSFLADLSGLTGLRLESLKLEGCPLVNDIAPLKGMQLKILDLSGTGIKDLEPLRGMPLVAIGLYDCKSLTNLAALQGMPFTQLNLTNCGMLTDLTPLRGMPLNALNLEGCVEIQDLTTLRGIPLNTLNLNRCGKVTDLSPLKDAFLTQINLNGTGIANLVGLQGMRFADLQLSECPHLADLAGLKGGTLESLFLADCPKLKDLSGLQGLRVSKMTIQNCTSLEDLSGLKGLPLNQLSISACPKIADLSVLRGMPLEKLYIPGCINVKDLTPLTRLPLRELDIGSSQVKDLAPLKNMPLTRLYLAKCLDVHDLSPLENLKLVEIRLPPDVTAGMDVLRNMPGLSKIDGEAARKYWKQMEPRPK